MKTTTSHTPTPWILNHNKAWHEGWKDRGSIFECHLAIGTHMPEDQNGANAAFIVRAVNAHQALLDALENTLHEMKWWVRELKTDGPPTKELIDGVILELSQAIAKAEKETPHGR